MKNGHPAFRTSSLIAGVDTHTDTHTLAILTAQGGIILTETFPANHRGYEQLNRTGFAGGHVL